MSIILNGIFKDDMVIQRDREIRIFGVTSDVSDNKIKAVITDSRRRHLSKAETEEISEDGSFILKLPPLSKGGPYTLRVSSTADTEKVVRRRIYAGEVWLAGGQSNMEYPLVRSEHARDEITAICGNNMHFYMVTAAGELDDAQKEAETDSSWVMIDQDTARDMSAVAYYFSKKVSEYLSSKGEDDLHIGIIGCYLGSTDAASWQSTESLEKTREGMKYINDYLAEVENKSDQQYETELRMYNRLKENYNAKASKLIEDDPFITYAGIEKKIGGAPWPPPVGRKSLRRPGALFDTMIGRIAPFGLRGVIFYLGEEDTQEHCEDYSVVFRSLIGDWRKIFMNDELPFLFCQLPMYTSKDRKYMGYDDLKWPKLRREQAKVAHEDPNTYMAVLTDCGEFDNPYPSDKKTPGERLAALALRFVYDQDEIPAVAPYVVDIRRGEGIEITFGGDYTNLNLNTTFASDDSGFEIAGENGVFYPALASVDFDGRTVILRNSKVEVPARVRYAYFSYGMANLVADTGLAAAPFEVAIDNTIGDFY